MLTETRADYRSYRVELVMRAAPRRLESRASPSDAERPAAAKACVAVRLGLARAAAGQGLSTPDARVLGEAAGWDFYLKSSGMGGVLIRGPLPHCDHTASPQLTQ